MTSPDDDPRLAPWEEEGRRHAASLDGCGFVVVVSDDPHAAAELALGLGRVQARRRRVVVADAVGELGPIDDLAPMDAPRGIVDVFVHGAPLAEVAHAVDPAGNLHVLPSGPPPIDHGALLRSARWERLAAEFREADALLLVVVPMDEGAIDAVLPLVDGVVLAGRAQPLVGARVLLYVKSPGSGGHATQRTSDPSGVSAVAPPVAPVRAAPIVVRSIAPPIAPPPPPPIAPPIAPPPPPAPPAPPPVVRAARATATKHRVFAPALSAPPESRPWPIWVAVIVTAALVAGGLYRATHKPAAAVSAAPLAADSAPPAAAPPADSAVAPLAPSPGAAVTQRALAAAADSNARAAVFAIELAVVSSATGANALLAQDMIAELPAITYSPTTLPSGDRSFHVYAGAYRDRITADSLLDALHARGVLRAGAGAVARVPFAVLVQSGVTRDEASFFATGYRSRGLPVYPLVQDDGTVRLYSGAFAKAADAELLLASVRANGDTPGVTYRTGRSP